MLSTVVRKNEPIEKAIRRFETECRKARIIQTFIEKSIFISPSQRKHQLQKRRKKQTDRTKN
ncbi:MAG: 30S ribosomal protein S21 [Bacteroidetes bacterium]|nr:30S ribosomal protein S21 [Bacteroidota bacterium]